MHKKVPNILRTFIAVGLVIQAPVRGDEPVPNPPVQGVAELADKPVEVPGLNLSIRLPVGTVAESQGIGNDARLLVRSSEDPKKSRWLFQVFGSVTRDSALTPAGVLDSIAEQRRAQMVTINPATRRRMQVREFDRTNNLVINGQSAARAYFDVPEDPRSPVAGYTVFMPQAGSFVIMQFDCPAENLGGARGVIETCVATTMFRDQQAENAERRDGLDATAKFWSSVTASELEAALFPEPVLLRLFRPGAGAGGADLEVGYQKITLRKGQLGEVAGTDKFKWSREDREYGYLAKIEARALIFPAAEDGSTVPGADARAMVDSVTVFWVSSDRQNETGSVVNVIKSGEQADTYVQTFVRRGDRLTVKTSAPGQEPRAQDYDKLPTGYLGRVEFMLLPRLVAARSEGAAFHLYTFDLTQSKLTLRRDRFERAEAGDGWTWTAYPYEAQRDRRVESSLDARGDLLSRSADGLSTQAVDGATLLRLWEGVKLPAKDR